MLIRLKWIVGMSDLQRYPFKLCQIKNDEDIHVGPFKNGVLSIVVSLCDSNCSDFLNCDHINNIIDQLKS